MIWFRMILVALVTIYIVDISGFTDSWRAGLARLLNVKALRPLHPFDCGQCMTWWMCLCCAMVLHRLSIETIAFSALLSLLSSPLGQMMELIREVMQWIIVKINPKW